MAYNPSHRFLVHDMNGFPRVSATTKQCAVKRARILAQETGLDMQVCYSQFHCSHILWVRTQHPKRNLNLNGSWSDARR